MGQSSKMSQIITGVYVLTDPIRAIFSNENTFRTEKRDGDFVVRHPLEKYYLDYLNSFKI